MKEKIYTIPVNEAFEQDCECSMCVLEKKLEEEYVPYFLGPSLMEPDYRMETNDKGFCRRHFELLYNRRENRLGLGLILDTHLQEQNRKLQKIYENARQVLQTESGMSTVKNITGRLSPRPTGTARVLEQLIMDLTGLQNKCAICDKLGYTMDRYIDVILNLWLKEAEFRDRFNNSKGLCLRHLRDLLQGAGKYLDPREKAIFTDSLMKLQLANMQRIQEEVDWFTKKFDYQNNDAPWGNSKDALIRGIPKIIGSCDLK